MKRRKERKKRFRNKILFVMIFLFMAAIGILSIDKGIYKQQYNNNMLLLVNRNNPLEKGYEPANLVKVSKYVSPGITEEEKLLNKETEKAYVNMCDEAYKAGANIYLVSGYRSYGTQRNIYDSRVKANGKKSTDKYTAKPGCSEHQTGLALDVTNKTGINTSLGESFAITKEGKWLVNNSYKYGFIIRYQKEKEKITGYNYEPWHIRYVGIKAAKEIYQKKLSLEEYCKSLK